VAAAKGLADALCAALAGAIPDASAEAAAAWDAEDAEASRLAAAGALLPFGLAATLDRPLSLPAEELARIEAEAADWEAYAKACEAAGQQLAEQLGAQENSNG
jgi:hypothetical protein